MTRLAAGEVVDGLAQHAPVELVGVAGIHPAVDVHGVRLGLVRALDHPGLELAELGLCERHVAAGQASPCSLKHERVVVPRPGPIRPIGATRHGSEVAVYPVVALGLRGAVAGGAARLEERPHALGITVVAPGLAQLLGGPAGARCQHPEDREQRRSHSQRSA